MQNYSRQREAIVRVLQESYDHPTAEEVLALSRKTCPKISLATVYRNLHDLAQSGEVLVLHPSDGKERFDGHVETPHAHFFCKACGKIRDYPLTMLQTKTLYLTECESFELNFYGLCEDCK
ncbi:MAG: transcriptional repressor [Clostridia bacterium]|nr:transcriptional repressor [Clostridia bacterium]